MSDTFATTALDDVLAAIDADLDAALSACS